MNQNNKEGLLIEKISQISSELGMSDEEIIRKRKTSVEILSQSEVTLQTFFAKFPSNRTINIQENLSMLPEPSTKRIDKLPVETNLFLDVPISGLIQISSSEILIYQDEVLKKERELILDGFAHGLKAYPKVANEIFTQLTASDEEILSAFCTAISRHGIFVSIPKNLHINNPLVIDIDADSFSGMIAPLYFLVLLEENASAEVYINIRDKNSFSSASFFTVQLEVLLKNSSRLNLFEVQNLSSQTDLALSEVINISENASLNYSAFDSGGLFVDHLLQINLEEVNAQAQITGLYKPGDHSTYYFSTSQNHNASNTKSDLLYKGVLGGEARVNWKGNIFVMKGTQGVDGYQMNNNLLTSNKVQTNSIPGLEILTDDVRCSHGVIISDIDETQRLYLQSRGISQEESEQLIIEGFLQKALTRLGDSNLGKMIKKEFPGSQEVEI